MNVNRTSRIAVAGLFLSMVSAVCVAQGNNSSYDPLTQRRSSKQKDGFVDSTLKQINPCDTDYGQHLDEGRRMVLEGTIESAYFWSNIVSLGLLGCLFIIIIYQHRIQRRREWSRGGNARAIRALPVTCECTGRGGHAEKLRPDGGLDSAERVGAPFSSASCRHSGSFPSAGAAKPSSKHTAFASIASEGQLRQTGICEHGKRSDNDAPRQSNRTLQTGG